MKVGLVAPPWVPVPPPAYGGTETVVDCLARGLVAAGHEVVLHATGDSTCQVPTTWTYAREQMARLDTSVVELNHVVGAYDSLAGCDVVHDHTLVGPAYAARFPRLPVVATNHMPFDAERRAIYRSLVPRVALVAISEDQRSQVPDIPVARVIHHGLDLDAVPFGDGSGGYLLWFGRTAPDKGAHLAIEVARRSGRPLVMAGKCREPEERRYFADEIRPRLGPGVRWIGEVGRDEKWDLFGRAVALVNPIRWHEPFGLVMVEALATGTPVVGLRAGAAPEIVDHGRTGFLCRDSQAMTAAVDSVGVLDRSACRADVLRRFSTARMVADHLSVYQAQLERVAGTTWAVPA